MSEKNTISIQVSLDPEELAEDLLNAGGFDIMAFILHLDEQIADKGFTIDLVRKLIGPLIEDNSKYLEYLASKALEQNFGDPPRAEWPHPSHPMHARNYAIEWEEEEKKYNTLMEVGRLLSSLVDS
jgi:hypothetical protein